MGTVVYCLCVSIGEMIAFMCVAFCTLRVLYGDTMGSANHTGRMLEGLSVSQVFMSTPRSASLWVGLHGFVILLRPNKVFSLQIS